MQTSIRCLWQAFIDTCAILDSTSVQLSIRRFLFHSRDKERNISNITVALKGHLKILIPFLKNNQCNRRFDICNYRFDVCTTFDSTFVKPLIQRLFDRRIDICEAVGLILVQPSIWRLCIYRFIAYITVDSTLAQLLIQRLCNRRSDARFGSLIYMPFGTWTYVIFNYLTSYLEISYYRNKF